MPPKRKAAGAAGAAAKGGKKAKKAKKADEGPKTLKDAAQVLKAADKKTGGMKSHKIDSNCHLVAGLFSSVVDDYDCMLNQTNIGHNNNKYYVIQLIQSGGTYYCWNRWGRVGEAGSKALKDHTDLPSAVKDFEKKFKDKTKNNWANRASFTQVPGKYTLIEMADEDEVDAPLPSTSLSLAGKKVAASALEKPTQALLKLLFDNDMFRDTMKKFDIDVKKMPLGKLSKGQIAKGFEVLDDIEKILNKNSKAGLADLSSKFYTVIPHNFGRKIPPVIGDLESLRSKLDMLMVLGDIEIAQCMQKEKDKKMESEKGDKLPNPIDVEYDLLNCELEYLEKKSKEFKVIETYTNSTSGGWGGSAKIREVWTVSRIGEDKRYKAHDKITNRKLLWHGTNVAVVAAILKSGLRIMPHSGGRVGAGIYFASENSKSAGYVGRVGKTGIMFLNEVALGRENHVTTNQGQLRSAPAGFDSVIAQGNTEPNPSQNTTLTFDGKKVVVPQGKAIANPGWSHSHFSQSEYLIYKESQNRIRYLLLMDF